MLYDHLSGNIDSKSGLVQNLMVWVSKERNILTNLTVFRWRTVSLA